MEYSLFANAGHRFIKIDSQAGADRSLGLEWTKVGRKSSWSGAQLTDQSLYITSVVYDGL